MALVSWKKLQESIDGTLFSSDFSRTRECLAHSRYWMLNQLIDDSAHGINKCCQVSQRAQLKERCLPFHSPSSFYPSTICCLLLWLFIGRTDAEAPILRPLDAKSQLSRKDPDVGKGWGQEEKRMTEDEMVGWHHWLNGHGFEQTPGEGGGWGSLVCCSPWGHKGSDTTERLNDNNNRYSSAGQTWGSLGKVSFGNLQSNLSYKGGKKTEMWGLQYTSLWSYRPYSIYFVIFLCFIF